MLTRCFSFLLTHFGSASYIPESFQYDDDHHHHCHHHSHAYNSVRMSCAFTTQNTNVGWQNMTPPPSSSKYNACHGLFRIVPLFYIVIQDLIIFFDRMIVDILNFSWDCRLILSLIKSELINIGLSRNLL